jgi:hypothetical protein
MAQFRDALWHSESHALAAERSIDPLGVGHAPYEVRGNLHRAGDTGTHLRGCPQPAQFFV